MKIFNEIEVTKIPRNNFNLSHEKKLSCDMGYLIPVLCEECVPGDTFKISEEHLIRFAPMTFPAMHRFDCFIHYFQVPLRTIWEDYSQFVTGGERGQYLMEKCPVLPRKKFATAAHINLIQTGTLADYLGVNFATLDKTSIQEFELSLLPFMAYQKIYDEYYRVQDLILSEIDPDDIQEKYKTIAPKPGWVDLDIFTRERKLKSVILAPFADMTDFPLFKLRKRSWQRDYFTTGLPRPQKGPEVSFGSGIVYLDKDKVGDQHWILKNGLSFPPSNTAVLSSPTLDSTIGDLHTGGPDNKIAFDPNGTLKSGLTTITELRRAKALQVWLERNARGGTRLVEYLKHQFGVTSSDKSLQRPQYIGGSHTNIVISEVLQTSESGETPLGEMAGHGLSQDGNYCGECFCEEHGFIIGIMSIMPKPGYMQGLRRIWQKFDPFDYFVHDFEHIGEQEIFNKELYFNPTGNDAVKMDKVFAYQSRFCEYKYIPDTVHGDFKTTMTDWHENRIFSNLPTLSQEFVECTPENRIFAVQEGVHHVWCQLYQHIIARRPLTVFSNPSTTI